MSHPFAQPPAAQDLSHAATQLACLEGHVARLCGMWNKPLVRMTSAYFAAIRDMVEADATGFEQRAGALAGLVEPMHWCFAAPMPFPRAHLGITESGDLAGSDAARTVRVDLLFQDSGGLLALDIGSGSRTPSQRRDADALRAAGVRIAAPQAGLRGDEFLGHLGPDFSTFADTIELPRSPFRGPGVPAVIS